jgi:ribA/ribD-fused uncharacterized protein
MNTILFYDTKGKYGILSNFYALPIEIDGETWPTTENYFQAQKFRGVHATPRMIEYSNLIREADSPMKSKMLGSQKKNTRFGKTWVLNKITDHRLVNDLVDEYQDLQIRPDWSSQSTTSMITALVHKARHPQVWPILAEIPDNTYLVEHTTRDRIWGDGGDGGTGKKGLNRLGRLWVAVITVLKYGDCNNISPDLGRKLRIENT